VAGKFGFVHHTQNLPVENPVFSLSFRKFTFTFGQTYGNIKRLAHSQTTTYP
jgi:hypothetical protein